MVAPMKCSLTGAIVNVILDPILIFGLFGMPQMGVAGAALATIIGQMCGMIMGVSIVLRGEHLVNIKIRGFKMDWKIVADIYKVGLPSIVMQSIASVMIIFYNMIFSRLFHYGSSGTGSIFQDTVLRIHAGVRPEPGRYAYIGI